MSDNPKTLFQKVWDSHTVRVLPTGETQLFVGLHLIHEVTSPQAFPMLRERGIDVLYPERTFATVDHIVPTDNPTRPLPDVMAETMLQHLERNTEEYGIKLFNLGEAEQGIVHVVGPEQGLTQPGMTIACGDSHTATHGAFGAIAFGIGTTQIATVLGTQTLLMNPLKVRRIEVNGVLRPGVTAKDVILKIIQKLGAKGGIGYAYEFAGSTIDAMSMEERMTVCNMAIEGGARCGYINPDQKTIDYLEGKPYIPTGEAFEELKEYWLSCASDSGAKYDDVVKLAAVDIGPTVTYGIVPDQSVSVSEPIPEDASLEALEYMEFKRGEQLKGKKIDVAFIGSCTNGRFSDLEAAALFIQEHGLNVAEHVTAIVVPGSGLVDKRLREAGYDSIFRDAGFEYRSAGCSMCLAMNPDKLVGNQLCASSSNRNFKGRQGSPEGRTLLMSPIGVALSASRGAVADVTELLAA